MRLLEQSLCIVQEMEIDEVDGNRWNMGLSERPPQHIQHPMVHHLPDEKLPCGIVEYTPFSAPEIKPDSFVGFHGGMNMSNPSKSLRSQSI